MLHLLSFASPRFPQHYECKQGGRCDVYNQPELSPDFHTSTEPLRTCFQLANK